MRTRLRTVALSAVILLLNLGSRARAAAIYWSDLNGGTIRTANLDGTGLTTLVSGLSSPALLALDTSGGKVYWSNQGTGDIRRANFDGSAKENSCPKPECSIRYRSRCWARPDVLG